MLPQQMGPASHRRFRLGGWQNDCSENRRSDGVRVASAGDVRPGGLGPGSFSLAWRPAIDAARYRGAGKACSRLQAAEGSCRQAHAAARSQHRARASAARLAPATEGWLRAKLEPQIRPVTKEPVLRRDLDVSADRRRRRARKTGRTVQERVRAVDSAQCTSLVGGSFAPSPLSTTLKIPYSMSGGGGGSVEALQAATIADAAMDRKKRARALQGHERACTSPTRQDAAHAQTGEIPAWSRVGRFALVYARRTVT